MIKLTDVLDDIIGGNPLLQLGLHHDLFNLTQTARYLHPLVETKAGKDVTVGALTMALSRLQKEAQKQRLHRDSYDIEKISMHTNLSALTYTKTDGAQAGVRKLHSAIQKKNGYMTMTEGTAQITVILESQFAPIARKFISQRPRSCIHHIASIGVTFNEEYLQIPGFMYIILQQMMLLTINIIEVSSTFTELVLYINEQDLKTAFEALENLFVRSA
jgi:hypothetical protein